jgi:MinD-like ATPase involved in chromosome partitioning or flagellar assembly
MPGLLRVATLAGDADTEAALAAEIASSSDVELILRCVDRVELLAVVRASSVDLIIAVGAPPWLDPQAVDEAASGGVRMVGVTDDPLDAQALARLGLRVTAGRGLAEIVASASDVEPPRSKPTPAPRSERGRLVAVWGPKGAPGTTSIAIELAYQLSVSEPDTLLIDADTYGGDVLQSLGIVEELPTLVWAARSAAKMELDATQLAMALRRASPEGPVVLPGIPRPELAAEVSDYGWRRLIDVVRDSFSYAVCDVSFSLEPPEPSMAVFGEGRNHLTRSTIKEAERTVAVCRADPIGIRNFLWAFDELRSLVDLDDVSIVCNRLQSGEEREVSDIIRRHTGRRPISYVPDDASAFRAAIRTGRSIYEDDPASDVTRSLEDLVTSLGGSVRRRGFLTRVGGRA